MRFATYNLRFDSQPDNITVQESIASLQDPLQAPALLSITTEQPWSARRIRIAEQLLAEGVVIAGEQDGLCSPTEPTTDSDALQRPTGGSR